MTASTISGRRGRIAWVAGLLCIGAATIGVAQAPVKQVLVLQSLNRGNLNLDQFTGDFRITLDQRVGKPVNVLQVVVGPNGFVGATDQAVVDYIRAIYAQHAPPDLIVTAGGPAAVFGRKYRQQLFPASPLLFASVDVRWLRNAPLGERESVVPVINDWARVVDEMLQVLPETRHVFMVIGSGALGRFWRNELEKSFARFHGRVTFSWTDGLSLPDIRRRTANLPKNSAIVYLSFSTDAQGGAYGDEQVIADLHAHANAPLFGALTPLFGRGIVGGSMIDVSDLARTTADVASRILMGESASISMPPLIAGHPVFDWRELQRWHIPETRLPPGSTVSFRRPGLWAEYKLAVLAFLSALLLQSFLITRLLVERRARQHAEIDARRNLGLAADANRRETISALTTSIGHELGQPLSAILHNAQALHMMVTANLARPHETREILTDIKIEAALATQIIDRHRTMLQSRQLNLAPINLHEVIDESLALVAHDMKVRHIETLTELDWAPCVIHGDAVLLAQVLVNLLRNAMDAMVETPRARRVITIQTAVRPADVQISVSDAGPGVAEEIIGMLFTPFLTTKSHGLGIGLTITQRIIDAHGGTIAAENTDAGAKFVVTLPRSANDPLVARKRAAAVTA